jgi:hypothetical protein
VSRRFPELFSANFSPEKKIESDSASHRIPLAMTRYFTRLAVRYTACDKPAFVGPDFGIAGPNVATLSSDQQNPEEVTTSYGTAICVTSKLRGTARA